MHYINLPQPPDTRKPVNENDWGDILTIGLHLKSRDSKTKSHQFGIYMGLNKVGIKDWDGRIIENIVYENSEDMHAYWILD